VDSTNVLMENNGLLVENDNDYCIYVWTVAQDTVSVYNVPS
jgi:hypothetical protein